MINHTVTINDNGQDKLFVIREMFAIEKFDFLLDISNKILKNEKFTFKGILQLIFNAMQSGTKLDNINDIEINKTLESIQNSGFIEVAFELFKSLITNCTKYERDQIMHQLISCITIHNGVLPVKLNMIEESSENINHYVNDMQTLFKLLFEVIKINYINHMTEKKS